MSDMNEGQMALRRLLYREIPENVLRATNADFGLTLGFGSTFGQALQAVMRKRATDGDREAAKMLESYGHLDFSQTGRDSC